jgi:hypothetical protein
MLRAGQAPGIFFRQHLQIRVSRAMSQRFVEDLPHDLLVRRLGARHGRKCAEKSQKSGGPHGGSIRL